MAASEEESGQSDSKNDDSATHETSKQFSTIHQEIENQLSRPGLSYENRVSAVLSGWEHLAGTVEGDVGQLQPLATFLYRWSLRLILQGEWPGLAQIVKTRLGVTLQRCSRVAVLQPLCRTLLPLVSDPWGQTTKTIFSDSEVQDEEAIKYISNETWEVVRVRVDTMVESRCEELAFRVLKVCIRCIRLRSEGMGVPLYTDEDHNHFVDLYFVLLYKFQRKAFLEEVKALDIHEGVDLVQRLVTKQDKAKVWKHRLKIADLAIQIFLATSIVKKYSHDFWAVFLEWCGVQEAAAVADDVLIQMIHKYMQLCEASQHIYSMGSILHKKFGNRLASLVTELLIRALTMDMNSLEALKLKQTEGSQKEEQVQLEQQMADGFMDLATVFTHHKSVARECVLTAFSLHPTTERLVLLSSFAGSSLSSDISHVLEQPHSFSKHSTPHPTSPLPQSSFSACHSSPTFISSPSSPIPHSSDISQPPCLCQPGSPHQLSSSPSIPHLSPSHIPPASHTVASSPLTAVPTSYSISSPAPHSPSATLRPEASSDGTEMELSTTCLQSTSTSADMQTGSFNTSQGIGVVQTTQSTTCLQLSSSDFHTTPCSQNDLQIPNLSTLENSTVSDPVHNSLNYVGVQNSVNVDNMEVTSSSEVQVSQNDLQTDELNIKGRVSPVSDQRGLSCEDHCLTDITIDTGQPYPNLSSVVDYEESQMIIENSAQSKMKHLSLSQTKDISTNDKELDSISHGESRMKDDVDSMDKFYKSTENFIEQLSQEPPCKSKLTNLSPGHQNYDVLTQPNQVLDAEQLGITKELCDDLAVVLSSPRWQVLSWMLDWSELSKICGQYIKDADSAKNMTKELKYLNIDYSQFQNMPSAEITEFTGIEKGYEHFIEHESENEASDDECSVRPKGGHISPVVESANADTAKITKRGRGRPKKIPQINRPYDSDSDLDAVEQLKGSSCYMVSLSESEESDIDNKNKTYLHMDSERSGVIEGKRVTAVSNQDRSKRIRIDAETGKLRKDRSLLNSLRLFRHQKYGGDLIYDDSEFEGLQRSAENFAPPLSSLNLNPRVVLTERDKSAVDQQLQRSMTTAMAGKRVGSGKATQSSQSRESWRYAGSFVAPNPTSTVRPATSVPLPRSPSVQCYVRHKDGKVRFASFNRSILAGSRPPNPGGQNNYLKLLKRPTSGYDDSYAKFLLQQNPSLKGKGPEDNAARKSMTLDASLDYLKKQGTTVTYRRKTGSALALANAQKTVLNRIMSPENAISAISSRTAIAMPVSNNPPNLPPSDKTNPANLSRVLPKGTTVVRRPKSDGAGPSGLSNNSGSGSTSGTRTVVSRPASFPTVVARPNTTVSSVVRSGSSVVAVRTNASTIRTTYSRSVVVTGSLGAQEAPSNRSTSPPLSDGSPSTPGGVPSGSGSSSSSTPAPLVSATVVGSVLTTVPSSSPMGTQSGNTGKQQQQQQQLLQQSWDVVQNEGVCVSGIESNTTITQMSSTTRGATTCTTTVASPPGDTRAASMLETLLRDRPVPPSPLHTQSTTAITTITAALPSTITSIVGSTSVPLAVTGESQVTNAVVGALSSTGNNTGNVVIASGSNANSGVIMASGVVGAPTGGGVVVASSGIVGSGGVGVNNSVGEGGSGAVQQVLLPGQIVQVHTSDGTTGIGIVQSSSLDLRLPAGTRVIKPGGGTIRTTAAQQQVTGVINQTGGRQVNVLHNVKILQNVQNRQIVRTVVVPHPVALQGLNTSSGQLKPQVVSLSQGTSTSVSTAGEGGVIQPQVPSTTVRAKIPPTTIVQKVLSRSGLVIRTVRPQTSSTQASGDAASFEEGLGAKLQQQQGAEGEKSTGTTATTNVTVARLPQDEGLGERLSHYLKTALASSTSTQSVGTQTLTTAVKPSAGQLVNQVAMNHLRSGGNAALSLSGAIPGMSGAPSTISTSPTPPQQANIPSLPLTPTNAVSSETLEQIREFESVFEKVSNKSGKEGADGEASVDSYTSTPMSSEESMIAAQLLSMANDNPAVTTSSSYVYSVPTTVYDASGTRLTEGTYITIPSTTQAGTLILVNHSGSGTGLVTVASGVQNQQQPPPAASPALSSTSSHSSIASSPSSTSSKTKKPPPKSKTVPPATPPVVAKPKTPPPPKAPAPKPTVAKPQLEESDETKARIQAILEQYKQDLANTPQPQPAPRNRKNCPPPKNEGKTSTKKKSPVKKVEGGAGNSPAVSEGSIVGCPSPSPSPGPANDNSVGPSSSATGGQPVQFSSQVVASQGSTTPGSHSVPDEKIKAEGSPEVVVSAPQLIQGVMVSNVKVEGSNLSSNSSNLAQGIAGGRFVQLIRHCGKVATITTRQPMNKAKSASQGGPPPNVTIQGRISMNDLMESHIASLLTGGGSALTQTPSVVSKIVQQQQLAGHQGVQQVVVQTSGGQQVLQQVSLQQLPTSPVKQQQQQKTQQKSSVIQQLCIASKEELSGASSSQIPASMASLSNALPNNMVTIANTNVLTSQAVSKITTNSSPSPPTNTSGIPSPALSTAKTTSVVTTTGTVKLPSLSSIPNSPLTPQTNAVTSPPTPQAVSASPHTPSPATEPSPTPSSFQMGEESNSSEQSVGEGLAGPLPPFLTLKSFIMRSPQQPSPQTQQTQPQKVQPEQKISEKCFTSGTALPQVANSSGAAQETATTSSAAHNKTPQRGNQSHVQLQISQPPRKPTTVIRSGGGNPGRRLIVGAVDANGRTVAQCTAGSLVSGMGEAGIATSPMSSSSHEGSPANTQSRIRLATRPQDMRSNSIDSLKSDLSVEEVQIPPSPATLTKQIQSAYMTEAALSPSVSQSQHSGSSYSSPSTTHDLPFTEAPAASDESSGGGLTQPGHSSAPPAPGLSVTGVSPEGDTQMRALTSPSGDVYLHQSGTGLGLESLEAGTLPLVSGMEVRTHSPALSDLVSSGPLLTWSPRSADSMMAQSPSLNDALTANIPLDVNHSEDSLCDSSTGFPGLFSIEGDGVSVSSSTSEDTGNTTAGVSNNQQHTLQPDLESQEQIEVTIDLHPRESEQDHTITSTRSPTQLELPVATLRGITTHNMPSSGSIVINHGSQDTPWRFDNTIVSQAKSVINQASEPTNGHHIEKQSADPEETAAGPSNNIQGKQNDGVQASYQKQKQKRGSNTGLNEQEVEDVRIVAEVVAMKGMEKTKKQSKSDGKIDGEVKKSQEGNSRKRSQYSACPPDKRKLSVINENEVKTEEIPTKNGHEDDPAHSNIKIGTSSVGRNKRRSSQRAVAASSNAVSPTSVNRTRTKPLKSEASVKQEHGSGLLGIDIKDEKLIKLEKVIKENSDGGFGRTRGAKKRTETDSVGEMKEGESQGEQKLGGEIKQSEDSLDMKFGEGECGEEMRRGGRGAQAAKRGDGYVLMEEEVQNHLDEDTAVLRGNRGRHISGTSDTSSNYSVECAVAPAVLDAPSISGGRRRRRHSRESSASSRDGSPLTIHSHEFPPSGVNTRRSSSRDHAKKKKCSCCVGGEQKKSTSGSGRRVSTRAARGSSSGSLQ